MVAFFQNAHARNASPATAAYNPSPPGFLPPDLATETTRVMGEIDSLEQQALNQWQSLPLNSGTAMRQIQLIGKTRAL
jgi:hypothetical protein